MVEERGERATGTPNTIYDLSSVIFYALEGGASYDQYIQDAEEAGDQELADFFRLVGDEDRTRANEAQRLFAERTSTFRETEGIGMPTMEGVAVISPRTESSSLSPGVEDLTPTRAGEAPPITEETPLRTEPISSPPGQGDVPPRRTEETPPLRPEPSGDPSGTEPMREEVLPSRTEEGLPTAEEVPRVLRRKLRRGMCRVEPRPNARPGWRKPRGRRKRRQDGKRGRKTEDW